MAKARQQYFADEQTLAKTDKEFAIENSLVEKINSIEEGAQVNTIETVKVNGVALEPDENKAVDISVPLVEDNLFSIDPDSALSANQGRILWENIYNLQSRGRYLSNWNCDTGLPVTNPTDNPYRYKAGDYYIVSVIAPAGGGHNYRPDGNVYIHNQASSVVEDSEVHVNDMYLFDGTNWLLVVSTERPIAVDPSLDITSHNPAENMAITRALNGKQDTISDLATIRAGAAAGATAVQPGDRIDVLSGTSDNITEGVEQLFLRATDRTKLNYLSGVNTGDETWETITRKLGRASRTNDGYLSHEDFIAFSEKQGALTAGDNIDITNGVISATYTAGDNIDITNGEISATYTAGTGIDITNGVISNTKGGEWGEITGTLSNQTDLQTALDGKVNLGENQVFDNTVVEIGKWEHGQTVDTSGHHVTLDPNGELSTYNVTVAGHNEATLGSGTLELLSNTALGGDQTATIDHEKIVADDGTNTNTYGFFGNDRIAKLSDISGATGGIVSDNPYTSSWDGVTTIAPSKNAVYDKLNAMDTTIAGKQDALTAGRNITISNNTIDADVDVDVVRVSTLSDQEAEALFTDLHYHIILYNDDIYLYEKTTTMGGDVFTITNHYLSVDTFESVGTSNSTLYKKTLEVSSWGEGHFYMTAGTVNISNVLSTSDTYTTAYTPTQDYNPATKKYVDDGLNSRIVVSSSTPSNPSEGLIWYDSTNDLLKVYDGTNWNVTGKTYTAGTGINISNQDVITADTTVLATQTDLAGKANVADVNTKTFYPINDTTDTATVQAIIEWIESGKNAIVRWDGKSYSFSHTESSSGGLTTLYYFNHTYVKQDNATIGDLTNDTLWMWYDSRYGYSTLSTYTYNSTYIPRDNTIQYTPTGDYNPATKKYVDDSISGIVFPAYTAGDGIDIDANNEVSVDASDLAGTGLTTSNNNLDVDTTVIQAKLTAGTGIDITSNTISADTTVLATKTDLSSKANASDLNTKTFPMTVATKVTDAQAAIDWVLSGKNALISLDNRIYLLDKVESGVYYFKAVAYSNNGTNDTMTVTNIEVTVVSDTVTEVHIMGEAHGYLETNRNYGTPFVPTQAGHPATKKYVDDSISGIVIPAYTAGTGLTLNNYEFAADTTVLATKADIANLGSFMTVTSLPSAASADTHTIYLLGPTGSGTDRYEEWIVTNQPVNETFVADGDPAYYYDPSYLDLSDSTTLTYISSVGSGNKGFNLDDSGTTYGYYDSNYVGPNTGWYQYDGETWTFVDSTSVTVPAGGYNLSCGGADTSFDSITISTGTEKTWTKIGEASMDLSNYFNKQTDDSDDIIEGSTNLFLTSSERTILSNTSGVNSGDETKSSIQTALGAATSSNSGYLTSTDWSTFNGKQNALTAGDGIDIDANNEISVDVTDIIGTGLTEDANNNIVIDTTVVATQTDISGVIKQGVNAVTNDVQLNRSSEEKIKIGRTGDDIGVTLFEGNINNARKTEYWNGGIDYQTARMGSPKSYTFDDNTTGIVRKQDLGDYLAKNNTTSFTPSGDYNPATKKYVDDIKPTSGAGAPSSTPTFVGQQYVDTTNNKMYVATGTSSSSDWTEVGAGNGDVLYADFNWVTKTGASITLDLNSTITPSANFVINAPATIKDGQSYILRVEQGATAYTMTLGTNITNPYGESLAMSANSVNQYTFLAIGGNLELQPSVQDYTAGTGINISAGKVVSADTTVLATQTDVLTKTNTTSYTPSADYNPATKKYVDDNVVQKSATAPSSPTEGTVWYDTTNDQLKVYDGTNWNVTGNDGAKIFYANTGDTGHEISDIGEELETWLNATGQTDDYDTFKDAVLVYDGVTYNRRNTFYTDSGYKYIYFISRSPNVQNNNNGTSKGYYSLVRFKFSYNSGWSYESDYSTSYVTTATQSFLRTDYDYSTPYTPLYNGSPATKKYVDDKVVDKSWQTATISSGAVTLGIRTRLVPTSNFTLNAPATIIDGEEYVLRCENTTSYTMTLGNGFTNPHNVSGTLSGQATDQFVFLAINGTLELQPLVTI